MDDPSNVLLNLVLVAALTPLLVGLGAVLKTVPPFKTTPEWVTIANLVIGPVIAVVYTWARADSAKVPATSVELVIAALSGIAAALAASKLYDATRAQMALSAKARTRRHAAPRPPPAG
jgi:hypothetical protein